MIPRNKLLAFAASVLCAVISTSAQPADTLRFIPTLKADLTTTSFEWYDAGNWYRFDPSSQVFVKAGHLPLSTDNAEVTGGPIDIGEVHLDTLFPLGSVITGGSFILLKLEAISVGMSAFAGSTIKIDREIAATFPNSLALGATTLTLESGAFALLTGGGALAPAPQLTLTGGSIFYNIGQVVLTDGAMLTTAGATAAGCFFTNRPNAVLSASGLTVVSGSVTPSTPLNFDNAGLVRCDGGVLTVGPGIVWTSANGVSRFKTATPTAEIFYPSLTVPAGLAFALSGPGVHVFPIGGPAIVDGDVYLSIVDSATGAVDYGNLVIPGGIAGTGSVIISPPLMTHAVVRGRTRGVGLANVPANLPSHSTMTHSGGKISVPMIIGTGSELNITGTAAIPGLANCTVENSGTINFTSSVSLDMFPGAVINNKTGALFEVKTDAQIIGENLPGNKPVINNAGIFQKSAGTGQTVITAIFNNLGLVDVRSGTLVFSGGGSSSGPSSKINVEAGYKARWLSAFKVGGELSGDGLFEISGPGVNFEKNQTISNLVVNDPGGLSGEGNLEIGKSFVCSGGSLLGSGSLQISLNALLEISRNVTLQRTLNNFGVASCTAGTVIGGDGAVINNSGQWDNSANTEFSYNGAGAPPIFVNLGAFRNLAGSQQTFNWLFQNNGGTTEIAQKMICNAGFEVNGGKVILAPGARLFSKAPSGKTPVAISAGSFIGSGTIDGDTIVAGFGQLGIGQPVQGLPGALTINGRYEQTETGTLSVTIGGTTAAIQYSQLSVNGPAKLSGKLKVDFNGFVPKVGDRFKVLTFASRQGGFTSLEGNRAPNGVVLVPKMSDTALELLAAADTQLSAPRISDGHLEFKINTTPGFDYEVQVADSLNPPIQWEWLDKANLALSIKGDGEIQYRVDLGDGKPGKFVRLFVK